MELQLIIFLEYFGIIIAKFQVQGKIIEATGRHM